VIDTANAMSLSLGGPTVPPFEAVSRA
jgi:hypothetical protein